MPSCYKPCYTPCYTPCYRHIGRAIQGVRADKPALLFKFADGSFHVYLNFHPGALAGERHQYLNADDVFCLEQEEVPLPFAPGQRPGPPGRNTLPPEDPAVSAYELERRANIARNQTVLSALGLVKPGPPGPITEDVPPKPGPPGPITEDTYVPPPAPGGGTWRPDFTTWTHDEEGVRHPNPDALGGQSG
jgi:hypothetical protein